MSPRLKRVPAHLRLGVKTHLVLLQLKPDAETVTVVVTRDNRRDAKSDHTMQLSLTAARELQHALQGAVDEGYRLQAEREARRALPRDLDDAVASVGRELAEGGAA